MKTEIRDQALQDCVLKVLKRWSVWDTTENVIFKLLGPVRYSHGQKRILGQDKNF